MSAVPSPAPGRKTRSRDLWRGQSSLRQRVWAWLRRHRIKLAWGTLLFAALCLFVAYVWLLLYAPKRTPLVFVHSDNYTWPLPPNAWAATDIEKLRALDGRSLDVSGGEEPVGTKADVLARLRSVAATPRDKSGLPLILWINLHGLADAHNEELYLIPSQAGAEHRDEWIRLDELAAALESLPPDRDTLLVLDCQRMRVNWHLGLVANQLAERVDGLLKSLRRERLSVLLAASANQNSLYSPELQGTAFAHFLQLGLAGAADRHATAGNADGWVSLQELHGYLAIETQGWGLANTGLPQTPLLLSQDPDHDFRLARCLPTEQWEPLLATHLNSPPLPANIPDDQLDALWQQLDSLRELHLYQAEPIAWRDLEHRLLWLEQLAVAGPGYRVQANRILRQTQLQLEAVQTRLAEASQQPSLHTHYAVLSGDPVRLPKLPDMHSFPMAQLFRDAPDSSIEPLRSQFELLSQAPTPALLQRTLSELQRSSASEYASTQFLRMLARYQFNELWQDTPQLAALLAAQVDLATSSVPGGGAVSPAQEMRVHNWIRDLLGDANRARRQAEDAVFVSGQPQFAERLQNVQGAVDELVAHREGLRQALLSCDQALAETGYLAAWITHPNTGLAPAAVQTQVDTQILPLISETRELAHRLAATSELDQRGNDIQVAFDRLAEQIDERVAQPLRALQADMLDAARRMVAESETDAATTISRADSLLQVPLLPWKQRSELRFATRALAGRLHENYLQGDTPVSVPISNHGEPKDAAALEQDYVKQIASWSQHPLWALLDASASTVPTIHVAERCGAMLPDLAAATSLSQRRTLAAISDVELRAAAPVWFALPEPHPRDLSLGFELQQLLLWHAQSSLRDFWGPAGRSRAFFDLAATDYLSAAKAISPIKNLRETQVAECDELRELESRLGAGLPSNVQWLATVVRPQIQLAETEPIELDISVRANGSRDSLDGTKLIPTGEATVLVLDAAQQRLPLASQTAPPLVGLPNADFDANLQFESVAPTTSQLTTRTLFRGHELDTTVPIERLQGIAMEVFPASTQASEVSLHSPWDRLDVAFVLDCSDSMSSPLGSSGEDAVSRLDIAKTSLQELLIRLAVRPKVRLGLHLFGHRLGWSTDIPLRAMVRPDYTGALDPELSPSQDVETVYALQDFDLNAARQVIPHIAASQPWGQSPLYLAIERALEDFEGGLVEAERHIIVITDGANYQYIPSSESTVATRLSDVREAAQRLAIPVHVLGLGMDARSDQQAVAEFEQLCRDTGGRYQSLNSGTDLQTALRDLLEPGRYRLGNSPELTDNDRQATLGRPIQQRIQRGQGEQYWLTYGGRYLDLPSDNSDANLLLAQESIWLEGGEALQLYVDTSGESIYAYPFEENQLAAEPLFDAAGVSAEHLVRVHQPKLIEQGVILPVSFQRWDALGGASGGKWRVTRRPAGVWIEVQPLDAQSKPTGLTYIFSDAYFEPQRPVPVMHLRARNWPAHAPSACIRVWCQPAGALRRGTLGPEELELPAPQDSLPVPPPVDPAPGKLTLSSYASESKEQTDAVSTTTVSIAAALNGTVPIEPGVHLRAQTIPLKNSEEPAGIRFLLIYDSSASEMGTHQIAWPSGREAQPSRVLRQLDADHRLAVHSFFFAELPSEWPESVTVLRRAAVMQGGWRTTEDIFVDVLQAGNLLPVLGTDSN